ncbi:MAG: endolytic transglycosylase MltG [Rhodospirillum sp.]|nr:endolytic transglycosylase MltG [Rhodospirillum sp.]MCF8492112.1 endolytic transglycosylase MltG [Rhodospirillum sp.]MCF8501160.1 endolytic transglycosylase MltG [Rhodospirillum sp.]
MRALLAFFLLLMTAGLAGFLGFSYVTGAFRATGPLIEERAVVIPPGSGVEAIARTLASEGVIADPLVFKVGIRLADKGRRLKAGEYLFEPGMSAEAVMDLLVSGAVIQRRFTVAEGLTTATILDTIQGVDGLKGPITLSPLEGALLPETYLFQKGDTRDAVVRRMEEAMTETLDRLWEVRAEGLPIATKEQALILASVVEKETGIASERPMVAGVFVNRLRKGMPLQSDPTVIYGLSGGTGLLGRALTRKDLVTEHAWNTYRIAGLPATPICNPGADAIAAVLKPAETDALYFVADGTGGHAFARTLDEHNRNVRAWRKIQKSQANGQ